MDSEIREGDGPGVSTPSRAVFAAELFECSGEDDHVHSLVTYPPKVSPSKLFNSLKGVSSRKLRGPLLEIAGRYHEGFSWIPSNILASAVSFRPVLAEYVRSHRADALVSA